MALFPGAGSMADGSDGMEAVTGDRMSMRWFFCLFWIFFCPFLVVLPGDRCGGDLEWRIVHGRCFPLVSELGLPDVATKRPLPSLVENPQFSIIEFIFLKISKWPASVCTVCLLVGQARIF